MMTRTALIYKGVLAAALATLMLSACEKKSESTQDSRDTAKTAVTASADSSESTSTNAAPETTSEMMDESPTAHMWGQSLKFGTVMMINTTHPNLTAEQKACLQGQDANAAYAGKGKEELLRILGEDGMKVSDRFYASEVGQKVIKYAEQQMQLASGQAITGETVTMTAEDEAKINEFMQSDIAKKVQADAENISSEAMAALMKEIADTELKRCSISQS